MSEVTDPTIPPLGEPPVVPALPAPPTWESLLQHLPPELANDATVRQLPDLPTAIKSLVDSRKQLGGMVKLPGADATPEERQAFLRKLGVPDSPAGYEVPEQAFTQDVQLDPALKDWLFGVSHTLGFTKQQVSDLLVAHAGHMAQQRRTSVANYEQNVDTLLNNVRTQHGAATERLLTLAARGLQHFMPPDAAGALAGATMQRTLVSMFEQAPWMLDMAISYGQEMAERGIIAGTAISGVTPDQARAEWGTIQGDPQHAYWKQRDPGHAAAVQKVAALFQVMHAGQREGRLVF